MLQGEEIFSQQEDQDEEDNDDDQSRQHQEESEEEEVSENYSLCCLFQLPVILLFCYFYAALTVNLKKKVIHCRMSLVERNTNSCEIVTCFCC